MTGLVLSLFPGIGMLDHAFELEGFTVVRGPDVIWGGDIRTFNPPSGVFDGVIGGIPCTHASRMHKFVEYNTGQRPPDLTPEFVRVVEASKPFWWLSECAKESVAPDIDGYETRSSLIDNRQFGEKQRRKRRISFGTADGLPLYVESAAFEHLEVERAVLGGHGAKRGTTVHGMTSRNLPEMLDLQGFARDWRDHCPLTMEGKRKAVGNGVPLPMGRAIARAVKRALESQQGAA